MESDRVLVLDAGKVCFPFVVWPACVDAIGFKVLEFDTPHSLLAKTDSSFYSLAKEAGLA